jgi:hypothetical protein
MLLTARLPDRRAIMRAELLARRSAAADAPTKLLVLI